jgi:hypothetical protein
MVANRSRLSRSVQLLRPSRLAMAIVAALGCGVVGADPASAGNAFGSFVGGVIGGAMTGALLPYIPRHQRYAPPRGPAPSAPQAGATGAVDTAPPSPADSSRALASLAPPSSQEQLVVLKSVFPSQTLGVVGSTDDDNQIGKARSLEQDRDYTSKIEDLIKLIESEQRSQHSTKEGDVTEHAILDALNDAVKRANLQKFETFLGENWSAERLRGMILDRVTNEMTGLFDGTNRGAVSMSDLDSIINKAARNVYARLFETSELLAANRGSTLFVQRLYQTHGDIVNGDVREDAERLLLAASTAGVSTIDGLVRRDSDAFALRYRAQRIIFDCLSENVEAISASDSGMATPAEIEKHVLDVNQQQCSKWVSAQLEGPDGKLKSQDPMPLRVIWSAEGPKDDPSMYGHASDQL